MSRPPTIARYAVVAGALLLAAAAAGCEPIDTSGPMETATTGSISAVGEWESGGFGANCIDTVPWVYTAVTLTGSEGETGPIVNSHDGTSFPSGGICRSFDRALFLRFGTWRVTFGFDSCTITIPQQMNLTMRANGSCEHR
jgi:hypothetical protein